MADHIADTQVPKDTCGVELSVEQVKELADALPPEPDPMTLGAVMDRDLEEAILHYCQRRNANGFAAHVEINCYTGKIEKIHPIVVRRMDNDNQTMSLIKLKFAGSNNSQENVQSFISQEREFEENQE